MWKLGSYFCLAGAASLMVIAAGSTAELLAGTSIFVGIGLARIWIGQRRQTDSGSFSTRIPPELLWVAGVSALIIGACVFATGASTSDRTIDGLFALGLIALMLSEFARVDRNTHSNRPQRRSE